ncbi:MAG: peptidylprolyl isomerase [Polyangiaceae bacterium]
MRTVGVVTSTLTLAALVCIGCDAPPEPTKDAPSAAKSTATTKSDAGGNKTSPKPPRSAMPPRPTAPPPDPNLKPKGPFPESTDPNLGEPSKLTEQAPDVFRVAFQTTQGDFEVECTRAWAPNGVDRFYNLVKVGFFSDVALFRVVQTPRPFVVQFGIHGNPGISAKWQNAQLPEDPVTQSNTRGMLTYAMAGAPTTRTTQLFINYGDNSSLDKMGFGPICKVVDNGMDVVDKFYSGYGERVTGEQGNIQSQGNKYLREKYPGLDYIKSAIISTPSGATPVASGSASAGPSAAPPGTGSAKAGPPASASAKAGPAKK